MMSLLNKLFKKKAPITDSVTEDEYFDRNIESYYVLMLRRFFQNKMAVVGVIIILVLLFSSIFANVIAPYDPNETHLEALITGKPLPPSKKFIWGTDALGRDFFTRCLYGGRTSLFVGFVATFISIIIGVPLGCIAGYYGGWVDNVICRFLELFNSIPAFFVLLILSTLIKANVFNMVWIIALFSWPAFVRGVRAYFLQAKTQDFVQAARNLGLSDRTIIFKHILPFAMMPVLITAANTVISCIGMETTLSFMGLGIREPNTSWGYIMSVAQIYLRRTPTMAIIPGVILTACTLGMNFIADGLRDAIDTRIGA